LLQIDVGTGFQRGKDNHHEQGQTHGQFRNGNALAPIGPVAIDEHLADWLEQRDRMISSDATRRLFTRKLIAVNSAHVVRTGARCPRHGGLTEG
jgi:hypothetical protein